MPYEIILSGSQGNCIVLNNNIILDVGVPYKKIEQRLKNIKVIFISHRHT